MEVVVLKATGEEGYVKTFFYSFCEPWMDFWMSDYRAMLAGQEQLEILAARG